jgi:gliding motility-associated-like protein
VILKFLCPLHSPPNGDNINDHFGVLSLNNNRLVNLIIYNGWGEIVFSTNDIIKKWDGKYNEILQPSDTFVYYLVMKGLSGDKMTKTGTVTLIR